MVKFYKTNMLFQFKKIKKISSNYPKLINNTYVLEKELDWKGIMIEYDKSWISYYNLERSNSMYVINGCTQKYRLSSN